jgi:hypothetical protein
MAIDVEKIINWAICDNTRFCCVWGLGLELLFPGDVYNTFLVTYMKKIEIYV